MDVAFNGNVQTEERMDVMNEADMTALMNSAEEGEALVLPDPNPRGNKSWMKKPVVGYTDVQFAKKCLVLDDETAKQAFPERKEVDWENYMQLGDIETTVTENVLKETVDASWYEKQEVSRVWTVKVFVTKDANIGRFQIIGESGHVPSNSEYALIYSVMEQSGLNIMYVEGGYEGTVRNGRPNMNITNDIETLEQAERRYEIGYRRTCLDLPLVIVQYCNEQCKNPVWAEMKAKRMIKAMCKKLDISPKNLWGYGAKINKSLGEEVERVDLNLQFKYPVSKKPGSKKRSKGGGGGATRIGAPSIVDRAVMNAEDGNVDAQALREQHRQEQEELQWVIDQLTIGTVGRFNDKADELKALAEKVKKAGKATKQVQARMATITAEASKMYDTVAVQDRVSEIDDSKLKTELDRVSAMMRM